MRLACKTMTYGVLHLTVATLVAYAFVGDLQIALGIGIIEPIIQTFVFALHDWVWERKKEPKQLMVRHLKAHYHI